MYTGDARTARSGCLCRSLHRSYKVGRWIPSHNKAHTAPGSPGGGEGKGLVVVNTENIEEVNPKQSDYLPVLGFYLQKFQELKVEESYV